MLSPDDPRHGTQNGYGNLKCRCERCKEAHREYEKRPHSMASKERYRRKIGHKPLEEYQAEREAPHGSENRARRCKCAICMEGQAEARKRRRRADLEASRAYDREYKRKRRQNEKSGLLQAASPESGILLSSTQ